MAASKLFQLQDNLYEEMSQSASVLGKKRDYVHSFLPPIYFDFRKQLITAFAANLLIFNLVQIIYLPAAHVAHLDNLLPCAADTRRNVATLTIGFIYKLNHHFLRPRRS